MRDMLEGFGPLLGIMLFIGAICLMRFIAACMQIKLDTMQEKARQQAEGVITAKEAENAELRARVAKLERRMANVETIVIEAEKKREFELL